MLSDLKKNLDTKSTTGSQLWRKVTATLLFGGIILVFVFWGLAENPLGVAGGGVVGQVNNKTISLAQFRQQMQLLEQRFSQFGGGQLGAMRQFLQSQALETLIDGEVVFQKGQDMGVWATNGEVRSEIVGIPAFQKDGRFSRSLYDNYLRYSRQSSGVFEESIRKGAIRARVYGLMESVSEVLPEDVRAQELASQVEFKIEYAQIDIDQVEKAVAKKIALNDSLRSEWKERAESYYNSNKVDYSTEEQVKARHILFKSTPGDAESEKKALAQAEKIAKSANKDNFAELAKKHSQDVGSQKSGGDLGFFGKGRMVKEFEAVAFSQEIGKVSAPVKSQFGYHLILVEEKKAAETKPFAGLQDEITRQLMAAEKIQKWENELTQAVTSGDATAVTRQLKKQGVKWQEASFNLASQTLSQISAPSFKIEDALVLSEQNPIHKALYRDGKKSFVVRYKSRGNIAKLKLNDDKLKTKEEQSTRSLSQELFRRLLDKWKKESDVQRNLQALRG